MTGKTVEAQARPDPMPLAEQRPGPPFFAILVIGRPDRDRRRPALRRQHRWPGLLGRHARDHGRSAARLPGPTQVAVVARKCRVAAERSMRCSP